MTKIVGMSGSLRKGSYNTALLDQRRRFGTERGRPACPVGGMGAGHAGANAGSSFETVLASTSAEGAVAGGKGCSQAMIAHLLGVQVKTARRVLAHDDQQGLRG